MALALVLAANAAEPPSPLVGATREQVMARYGEPKSQIVIGNRVILNYQRERVILRDGVVVDVEKIAEPRVPTPAPAPAATDATATAPAAGERSAAPAATAPASSGTTAPSTATTPATGTTAAGTAASETPAAPAEPRFEIKSIRAPGVPPPRPITKQEAAPAQKTQPAATAPSAPMVASAPTAEAQRPSASSTTTAPSTTTTAINMAPLASTTVAPTTPPETEEPKPDEPPAEPVKAEKKAKPVKKVRKAASEPDIPDTEEIINSKGNYVIAFLVAATGIGYIVWQIRSRKLALAATAVSRAPFSMPIVAKSGVTFNAELLQNLEWKRFEELVASYYSKTGVVAVRTKSGPAAPVHIKISWKGESRPFAYVQCIAQPGGLIDSKPLQDLVNSLAADDIRRGYVVSTGKFSVNARDLAEEKHITLLPGDIFLEKINALPDAARSELMQQTTTGDYTTPSCPKCEAKMVRSLDDPMIFRCPTHPDQQIASRG